jgi:hypothetical protein
VARVQVHWWSMDQRRDIALAHQRWDDFKSRDTATEFNQ